MAEQTLDHLQGYRGSRPVRVGNGAAGQRQLDVYGEILDWAHLHRTLGGKLTRDAQELLASIAAFVSQIWREPDQGSETTVTSDDGRSECLHRHSG